MAENLKKVVTLDAAKVLVDKIRADYATKESVTQQIKEAGGVGLSDASEAEILALFEDSTEQEAAGAGD